MSQRRLAFTLAVLFGINTMNFFDRQVLGAVGEAIKKEWDLSDRALGALGTAFTLLYAAVGLPLGRWADTGRRSHILAIGAGLWSLLTSASALAWNFTSLFLFRLGVGVGEASCAPAANALIADLFPAERRARAISIFMLGLPLGLGASYAVSGSVAQRWGWRVALLAAGLPGIILALLALAIPDPRSTASSKKLPYGRLETWGAIVSLLKIPTFWWIIISGALHNFNMYALGQFQTSFLVRYHHLPLDRAGWVSGLMYGGGGLGILLGGWVCDRMVARGVGGRLEAATLALLVFVPCSLLALAQPAGHYGRFALWFLPGLALSYVYYSGVYASIQDLIDPSRRGLAMALYFFVMYLLGGSIGPVVVGWLSDVLARRAAGGAEITEAAKATGLYHAMYAIPILATALVVVLFTASRTIVKDHARLHQPAIPA